MVFFVKRQFLGAAKFGRRTASPRPLSASGHWIPLGIGGTRPYAAGLSEKGWRSAPRLLRLCSSQGARGSPPARPGAFRLSVSAIAPRSSSSNPCEKVNPFSQHRNSSAFWILLSLVPPPPVTQTEEIHRETMRETARVCTVFIHEAGLTEDRQSQRTGARSSPLGERSAKRSIGRSARVE